MLDSDPWGPTLGIPELKNKIQIFWFLSCGFSDPKHERKELKTMYLPWHSSGCLCLLKKTMPCAYPQIHSHHCAFSLAGILKCLAIKCSKVVCCCFSTAVKTAAKKFVFTFERKETPQQLLMRSFHRSDCSTSQQKPFFYSPLKTSQNFPRQSSLSIHLYLTQCGCVIEGAHKCVCMCSSSATWRLPLCG